MLAMPTLADIEEGRGIDSLGLQLGLIELE